MHKQAVTQGDMSLVCVEIRGWGITLVCTPSDWTCYGVGSPGGVSVLRRVAYLNASRSPSLFMLTGLNSMHAHVCLALEGQLGEIWATQCRLFNPRLHFEFPGGGGFDRDSRPDTNAA